MKLHELPAPPRRPKKRVGRGIAAGQGKTAGRGTKGQRARTGFKLPRRFEGGQSSLIMRLPKKRGFRTLAKKPLSLRLERVMAALPTGKITPKALFEAGLISAKEKRHGLFKLVGPVANLPRFAWSKEIKLTKRLHAKLGQSKTPA